MRRYDTIKLKLDLIHHRSEIQRPICNNSTTKWYITYNLNFLNIEEINKLGNDKLRKMIESHILIKLEASEDDSDVDCFEENVESSETETVIEVVTTNDDENWWRLAVYLGYGKRNWNHTNASVLSRYCKMWLVAYRGSMGNRRVDCWRVRELAQLF